MLTITIQFPAKTYHATPWGSHVNEGIVEWPPSPWRILRSLLATGFTKLGWPDLEHIPPTANTLFHKMAEQLPSYRLPATTAAHTRHYMPVIEGRNEKRSKILDTFLRLCDDQPLLIHYPQLELAPDEKQLLEKLLANLSYLGRAESWVEASLCHAPPDCATGSWCIPRKDAPHNDEGELVNLLVPDHPHRYLDWRQHEYQRMITREEQNRGKKLTAKQLKKIQAMFPESLLHCLSMETADIQDAGWNQPPGATWIPYLRPREQTEPQPLLPPPSRPAHENVQAILLALSSDTVRGNVLPLLSRAVPQAELLHRSFVAKMDQKHITSSCLRGTDDHGRPLRGHRHAHYIPLDLDEDNRIDHVLMVAPDGFAPHELTVIRSVRRTWSKGIDEDIIVTCVGAADLELFRNQLRTRSGNPIGILTPSTVWHSLTPFIMPRHIKKRKHTPEDQVRAEFQSRNWPQPIAIHFWPKDKIVSAGFLRFVRTRSKQHQKPQPPATTPWGMTLIFDQPFDPAIHGPLTIGYGAHWGLGLFTAKP